MAFGAKIKLSVDKNSQAAFKQSIQDCINSATEKGIKGIKITDVDLTLSKESTEKIVEQVKSAASNIKGLTISIDHFKTDGAVNKLKSEIQEMMRGLSLQGFQDFAKDASDNNKKNNKGKQGRPSKTPAQAANSEELNSIQNALRSSYGKISKFTNPDDISNYLEQYRKLNNELQTLKKNESERSSERMSNLAREAIALKQNADTLTASQKKEYASEQQIASLRSQITTYASKNTKVYKESKDQFDGMTDALNSGEKIPISNFNSYKKTFNEIKDNARAAGIEGKTFFDILKSGWEKFGGWSIVTKSMMTAYRTIKDMITSVKELDAAMTELKKVTDLSDDTYTKYISKAAKMSQSVGASLTDAVTSTADFARLGYDLDDAKDLAQSALIYKNVGDGIKDISTASESIISTMKAFNIEAGDSIDIVDKFNEVGNRFAISSEGLGEALKRSASAMAEAGNSLDETIALATGMNAVVQDPEKVGTALKSMSMYLRAAKTEADTAGESTDGMANSVSELRKELLTLTNNKVDIMLDDKTFKSTYQIMKELSGVWSSLSDVDTANILELIGGKRNATAIASLVKNFDDAENALEASKEAAGSATEENEKYLDSVDGKMSVLSSKFEELSNKSIDSDLLKGIIDFGIKAIDVVGDLISKLDSIPAIVGTIAAGLSAFGNVGFFKNPKDNSNSADLFNDILWNPAEKAIDTLFHGQGFEFSSSFSDNLSKDIDALNNLKAAVQQEMSIDQASALYLRESTAALQDHIKTTNIASLSAENFALQQKKEQVSLMGQNKGLVNIKAIINEYNKIRDGTSTLGLSQEQFTEGLSESNRTLANYLSGIGDADGTLRGYGVSLVDATLETVAMTAKTMLLNAATGALVSLGISALIKGFTWLVGKMKPAEDIIKETTQSIKDSQSSIKSTVSDFQNLKESTEGISSRYAELRQGVDDLGNNIDLTDGQYTEFISLNRELAELFPDLVIGYNSNGEAILSLSGNVDTIVKSLKDLIETQRQVAAQKILDEDLPDLFDNTKKKAKAYGKQAKDTQNKRDRIVNRINETEHQGTVFEEGLTDSQIIEDLEAIGLKKEDYYNLLIDKGFDETTGYKMVDYKDVLNSDLVKKKLAELQTQIDNFTKNAESAWNSLRSTLSQALVVNPVFQGMDNEGLKTAITKMVSSVNIADLYEEGLFSDAEGLQEWLNDFVDEINTKATPEVQQSIADMFQLDEDKVGKEEYRKKLMEFFKSLKDSELSDEAIISLKVALDFDKTEILETREKIDNAMSEMSNSAKYANEQGGVGQSNANLYNKSFSKLEDVGLGDVLKDKEFKAGISSYVTDISKLQEALTKYKEGNFSNSDFNSLVKQFPQLEGKADHLGIAIKSLMYTMRADVVSDFDKQFDKIDKNEITTTAETLTEFKDSVLSLSDAVGTAEFSLDINAQTEGIEEFNQAISESVSAVGLSTESIEALEKRYKSLPEYDPSKLFEATANGIHLNTAELRKLEKAYEDQQFKKAEDELADLVAQYDSLTDQIRDYEYASTDAANAEKLANLYKQRSEVEEKIRDNATLLAQYEGLVSAYKKWQDAQASPNERDMYEGIISGKEDIEDLISRGWGGSDDVRTYVDLISNEDLSQASAAKIETVFNSFKKKIGKTGFSIWDFFTADEDGNTTSKGVVNFMSAVNKQFGNKYAWKDKNGAWNFDFNSDEIAEKFGISTEAIQSILRAGLDAGADDINLETLNTYLKNFEDSNVVANNKLKSLNKTNRTFNFEAPQEADITEAQKVFDSFEKNKDGTIDLSVEGAKEAKEVLVSLIKKKQEVEQEGFIKIDTDKETDKDLAKTLDGIEDFFTANNEYEVNVAIGADKKTLKDSQQKIKDAVSKIDTAQIDKLNLPDDAKQKLKEAVKNIQGADLNAGAELDQSDIDIVKQNLTTLLNRSDYKVNVGVDSKDVENYDPDAESPKAGTVNYSANFSLINLSAAPNLVGWVTYKIKSILGGNSGDDGSQADGTAHANGTATSRSGIAKAHGDWGTKNGGIALGGELGQELVVRDGHFFTIGDKSAEFFKYKKGDIIFNADQTEEIFKNGKIRHSNKRGRAYRDGTTGAAYDKGSGLKVRSDYTSTKNKKKKKNKSSQKDTTEVFDWIEVLIDRIERAIERLEKKAKSAYRSWSSRNDNLHKQISETRKEIGLQQKAYDSYMRKANSVGLSANYKSLVRSGSINFSTITDENLSKKIKEYQDWYEKALDCKDAIDELTESVSELYETAFENVEAEYDGYLSVIEHEKSILDEYVSQSEAKGYITSVKYYEAMIAAEKKNISQLQNERNALTSAMNNAVNSGAITKGSEAWYDMVNSIDKVTLSIEEANTALLEYKNNIRETKWEIFDLLQDNISQITDESDFLVDLMSNNKLVDDKGKFTDEGMATIGLHGVNYNTYMAQADKYAKEMKKINAELAKDPANKDLLERRNELLESQRDAISSAEDEKQAIKDLVEDGYNAELDALKELIDKYNKALDSQKDLYDYQKNVKEQTKEIASLQKQLNAYAGDVSEETKAKIQQLRVSLEDAQEELKETEYDKYISDQKEMLDNLYDEYEKILNERLDDVDALIGEMINSVNDNATSIRDTIVSKADDVGYTLTESMTSIWNDKTGTLTAVITQYGDNFSTALTTVNATLSMIDSSLQSITNKTDKEAATKSNNASQSSSANPSKAPSKPSNTTKPATSSNSSNNFFTYKKDSYPKNRLNKNGSIVDRLKYFNFDSSFSARKRYYSAMGFGNGYTGTPAQNNKMLSWMKNHGYKNGKFSVSKDEYRWTQENGEEIILRPTDGAILTPLVKGDRVLNKEATANLYKLLNNPSGFVAESSRTNIGNIKSPNIANSYNGDINFAVTLPNVSNYNEFKYALQHDKSFEKVIQSMTIDRIAGGSSIKKYKY